MLKYVLLGFLSYLPLTGYELEGWMNISTSNFWQAKLSQIYTTLKKLEEEGAVTSQIAPQEGRPDRRVYTITEAGLAELYEWQRTPILDLPQKKDALLVKVFFGLEAGKEAMLTQLRLQLDLHRRQQQHYAQQSFNDMQHILEDHPELVTNAILWDSTRRFGVMYEEMYIGWLQETIAMVEKTLPDDEKAK